MNFGDIRITAKEHPPSRTWIVDRRGWRRFTAPEYVQPVRTTTRLGSIASTCHVTIRRRLGSVGCERITAVCDTQLVIIFANCQKAPKSGISTFEYRSHSQLTAFLRILYSCKYVAFALAECRTWLFSHSGIICIRCSIECTGVTCVTMYQLFVSIRLVFAWKIDESFRTGNTRDRSS